MIENHPHRSLADLGRKLVRRLARHGYTFSGVGASDKPGAVETDDTMNTQTLLGKSADADLVREMIGFAAQRLMGPEVGALIGAGYGEKSSGRLTQRKRDWNTRAGAVELHIPKLRQGSYFPGFLKPAGWPRRR